MLLMLSSLGFAVYVSTFEQQKPMLERFKGKNFPIFTSLHIGEEMSDTYVHDVEKMCQWLHENDFYILADVSPYTLERFDESSLSSLVKRLHIDNLRLDFGFNVQDLKEELKNIEVTYNASTLLSGEVEIEAGNLYMHNFYPRPETGLDPEFFIQLNQKIQEQKGQTLAFISGDELKRGPIHEGLPTLEHHRFAAPYAQYIDLTRKYKIDKVYLGDLLLSEEQQRLILKDAEDGILRLPVKLPAEHQDLYEQKFTVRIDSPKTLARVQESREFAQQGKIIEPTNTTERKRGSITIDNKNYQRYSGEIQITKDDYPADKRINVMGQLEEKYLLLLDHLTNGESFMFVPTK